MKKLLITGAYGQVGRCLQDRVDVHQWQVMAVDADTLDITNESAVNQLFNEFKPDVVINAAAYTAVDKAEEDATTAAAVNATGPKLLAVACAAHGAALLHISTDYVFDGASNTAYREGDALAPLGVYGQTKLNGDQWVAAHLPRHIILRTAWVFSEYGNNFVKTMLRLAKERSELGVVNDQFGCPTYAGDIAAALLKLAAEATDERELSPLWGTYHFCGDVAVSWCEFARQIFSAGVNAGALTHAPLLKGISSSAYPTVAKRPSFSVLDCSKVAALGIRPSNWMFALNSLRF
jgi:dTDP-4-dehydrorhamnose reductase